MSRRGTQSDDSQNLLYRLAAASIKTYQVVYNAMICCYALIIRNGGRGEEKGKRKRIENVLKCSNNMNSKSELLLIISASGDPVFQPGLQEQEI